MREMVFNHSSVRISEQRRDSLSACLKDIVQGMSQLAHAKVVEMSLRMSQEPYLIECFENHTLGHAFETLRKLGYRDEYVFLSRLATRSPLVSGIEQDVKDRFYSTGSIRVSGTDEEPPILCAITDWILVSIPSRPSWDCDRLVVQFFEPLLDGSLEECSEHVDQLSRSRHAKDILDRHVKRVRSGCNDPVTLWARRQDLFPSLSFGPSVERDLISCANQLPTIIGKLIDLDEASREWFAQGGPAPRWRTRVTPESRARMANPKFVETRTFKNSLGSSSVFEWHARFGNSGRIHLRFEPTSRMVEIGYIGSHLPS